MNSRKLHRLLFWLLLTASLSNATAQEHGSSTDKGLVVYTLGSDTTTVQYFQFEERRFKTIILDLDGTVRKYEGVGLLDENGDIKEVHSVCYQLDAGGNWSISNEGDNVLHGDSTIYTAVNQGKVVRRRAVAGKAEIVAALEKYIGILKEDEAVAAELLERGRFHKLGVIDARFRRMEAERWLNEEKAR